MDTFGTTLAISLFAGLLLCAETGAVTLHVAPNGNDAWSGQLAEPNAAKTDGPLASLTGARDALRKVREAGGLTGPTEVIVQDGVYRITEPLLFTGQDSGSHDAPITYAAAPGAHPVISGGKPIGGWTKGEGNLWVTEVPEVKAGQWYFHELFVDGQRATRARTPNRDVGNQEYLRLAGPLPEIKNPNQERGNIAACMGFTYTPGDMQKWAGLDDVNVFVYHSWTCSLHWIKELDEQARTVRFTARSGWPIGYWDRHARYYVENFKEALDSPGEWYLERATGKLYYWPLDGKDPNQSEVTAPVAKQLVRLLGDAEIGQPVTNLTFRGLSFQHCDWEVPNKGSADGQSAMHLNGAVHTRGALDCAFIDCEIAHVGQYGVFLDKGSQRNTIQQCEIHDLGGGGVRIGETSTPASPAVSCDYNTIDNCFIHDGGHVFHAGCGVIIARASHNRVTHNEICDFFYSGMSIGWSWGYAATTAQDNVAEYNHVHHLGWGDLSDMGGIYTLGVSPGTKINHNVFHDVLANTYGGWGLYTDEGSSTIEMAYNVVYNTKDGGFHQHYGKDNHIHHNVFAKSSQMQIRRSRQEEHNSFDFDHNIVCSDHDQLLSGSGNNRFTSDSNLYWDTSTNDPDFDGDTFADWQQRGHDAHSLVADPKFVDPANHDYHLQADSPAKELGIQSIDISLVGLYGDAAWVDLPKSVQRPVMVFPKPQLPEPVDEDFESTAVGEPAPKAHTGAGENGACILVTDETAASGKHSLKFLDAPGQAQTWMPHMYWRPDHKKGTAVVSFDLRVEPGAKLYHEWRNAAGQYVAGPTIRIEPNGALTVAGTTLLTVPHSKWFHVEIHCKLGSKADGTFDLTVTLPGEQPKAFEGLACSRQEFKRLQWLGFISEATDTAVFYLDNVKCSAP